MELWIWIGLAGGLLIAEMLTVDLLFASLAFSAAAAALANWLGFNAAMQGVFFGFFALISILLLRPIVLKHIKKRTPLQATNVQALIGAEAVTITEVDIHSGQIKLGGEIWSATSRKGPIPAGKNVHVIQIDGATALVTQDKE